MNGNSVLSKAAAIDVPVYPHLEPPHRSAFCLIKRTIDIGGALLGVLIFAILFIPLAIAIKLDSPGPVLYQQIRYGLQGRPIIIRKFRSMVRNADALKYSIPNEAQGLIFKNKRDPRVTRVGRLLRKTSLDEFPQFWNVLVGEMSLVGTRPPTHDEVVQYGDRHWKRLNVKPGLTGEWQVNGRSAVRDFEEVVDLDLHYQAIWTPLYDLSIIWRTVAALITKQAGAY